MLNFSMVRRGLFSFIPSASALSSTRSGRILIDEERQGAQRIVLFVDGQFSLFQLPGHRQVQTHVGLQFAHGGRIQRTRLETKEITDF